MSHRKKLEALAERRSGSKELDPELADGFGDTALLSRSSRRAEVDAALDASKGGKRSKMRSEAHMREVEEMSKYRGAVVPRPKYQDEDDDDGLSHDDSEDDGSGDGSENEEEGSSGEEQADTGDDDDDDDDEDDDDEDDDDDDVGARGRAPASAAAGLAADVDAELHALERSDGQALLAASKQTASDAQQGVAVRQQLGACTLALETRVRLQPLVAAAARFPGPEAHAALCAASAPLSQSFAALRGELASLLRDLISLQAAGIAGDDEARPAVCAALRIADPAAAAGARKRRRPLESDDDDDDDEESGGAAGGSPVAAKRAAGAAIATAVLPKPQPIAAAASGKKKARKADAEDADAAAPADSADALWSSLTALDAAAAPNRNDTLNGWARRLAYSGGVTARKAGKLKVLAADLTAQVDDLLNSDRDRLLTRTRPRADAVAVLGERRDAGASGSAAGAGAGTGSADAGASATPAAAEVDLLEHAFDDSELYTALLRELVSAPVGASAAAGAAGGALASAAAAAGVGASAESLAALLGGDANAAAALLLKHKSVKRAGIDRRATKGRRLKFTAMPKLVGFMAPAPYVVPPDRAFDLDTLVASLFKSMA